MIKEKEAKAIQAESAKDKITNKDLIKQKLPR
jgi:hypothetical protein